MFKKIKEFFVGKPAEVVAEVPYKVEAVNTAPITPVADKAVEAVVKSIAPAKKTAKKPAAKKPGTPKPKGARKPKAKPAQQ